MDGLWERVRKLMMLFRVVEIEIDLKFGFFLYFLDIKITRLSIDYFFRIPR